MTARRRPGPGGGGPDAAGAGHDAAVLRRVFSAFPTGVTAVAALEADQPVGLAANSFTSVSLDPPIVSVCIRHGSMTWPRLREAPRLGVSVLASHQQRACRQLSGPAADRFAGVTWQASPDGAVVITGASAWLECSIETQVRIGDHDVIFLRVHDLDADASVAPLVFHGSRFRELAA